MRNVTIPASITVNVQTVVEGKPTIKAVELGFVKGFLLETVLHDPKWGKSSEMLHAAFDIRSLFAGKAAGEVVQVSTDLYSKLLDVVQNPTNGYNPGVMLEAMAFFDAIEHATNS